MNDVKHLFIIWLPCFHSHFNFILIYSKLLTSRCLTNDSDIEIWIDSNNDEATFKLNSNFIHKTIMLGWWKIVFELWVRAWLQMIRRYLTLVNQDTRSETKMQIRFRRESQSVGKKCDWLMLWIISPDILWHLITADNRMNWDEALLRDWVVSTVIILEFQHGSLMSASLSSLLCSGLSHHLISPRPVSSGWSSQPIITNKFGSSYEGVPKFLKLGKNWGIVKIVKIKADLKKLIWNDNNK